MLTAIAAFGINPHTAVVTTTYVTRLRLPILFVSNDEGEDGNFWQFHADNGDYAHDKLQLVTLSEVIALDSTVAEIAKLPIRYEARRRAVGSPWVISKAPT